MHITPTLAIFVLSLLCYYQQGGRKGARAPPIFGTTKTSAFSTNVQQQGLRQLFLTLSWDLRAQRGTPAA